MQDKNLWNIFLYMLSIYSNLIKYLIGRFYIESQLTLYIYIYVGNIGSKITIFYNDDIIIL